MSELDDRNLKLIEQLEFAQIQNLIENQSVLFKLNTSALSAWNRKITQQMSDELKKLNEKASILNHHFIIEIKGDADKETGSPEFNDSLAKQRAKEVRIALQKSLQNEPILMRDAVEFGLDQAPSDPFPILQRRTSLKIKKLG